MSRISIVLLILGCNLLATNALAQMTVHEALSPDERFWKWDTISHTPFPRHFRSIARLKLSGSGQFTEEQWKTISQLSDTPGVVVDLREEAHLFFNHQPISWYGPGNSAHRGISASLIETREKAMLAAFERQKNAGASVVIYRREKKARSHKLWWPGSYPIGTLGTEQDLISKSADWTYHRFPLSDHRALNAKQLQQLLEWLSTLDPKTWLHVHCHAGSGRTTAFMILYNLYKARGEKPWIPIVESHYRLLGKPIQVQALLSKPHPTEQERLLQARIQTYHQFHYLVKQERLKKKPVPARL